MSADAADPTALTHLTAHALAERLRAGEITSREATLAALDAADGGQPRP